MSDSRIFYGANAEQYDLVASTAYRAVSAPVLHYVTKPSLLKCDKKAILPIFDISLHRERYSISAVVAIPLRPNEVSLPITWLPDCHIGIHVPTVRHTPDGKIHPVYRVFHPSPRRTLSTEMYATKVVVKCDEEYILYPPRASPNGYTHPSLIHAILASMPISVNRLRLFTDYQDTAFNFYRFGSLPAYRPGDLMNHLVDTLYNSVVPYDFWMPGSEFIEMKYLSKNGKRYIITYQHRNDNLLLHINTLANGRAHREISCIPGISEMLDSSRGIMYSGYFALETILYMMENYLR